jgi:hypothetical protein
MTATKPNEPLYIDLLLLALARGNVGSVVLTADAALPDPATLTADAQDLAWFASVGLAIEAQSAEKVIQRVLEAAGFRRFHLRKTEGLVSASLEAHDGASATDFDFRVTKRTDAGPLQIEITPLRA